MFEQILKIYGIPTVIIEAIMMLYRNTRSMVRFPNGDAFSEITPGILQGDTLALFTFQLSWELQCIIKK